GLYEILDRFGIFAIEWPDYVLNDLGADFLSILFEFAGDDTREIRIAANGEKAAKLMKKL
ncbi:MAG: hypothetical protein KKE00_00785, partial [Proteobacteria bacterium]|nr:hypothetical protein [Pseudomonadota bacterium]